ncbi:MAG: type II toxin-antitoxin system VapC family toxin [Burkholderiaceae bacterium]|nr:type II toxin-antitoxin system VapC family toxin [Burkholderiaceae bacterium]
MPRNSPRPYVAEPPAHYRVRPPLIVDCSVVAALLFDEPQRDEALAVMSEARLFAPFLLDTEMVSVALRKSRLGLADAASLGLADYRAMPIERHEVELAEQMRIALDHGLTAYDAAYLALAAKLRAPLATFDQKLARAAERHLGSL